jgi:hypothetical protein
MARNFLLCLPLCLLLAPSYPGATIEVPTLTTVDVAQTDPAKSKNLPDPQKNTLGFLRACLKKYDETVKGYTLTFEKQERVAGKLSPREIIKVCFRDEPHSVYFDWQQGAKMAQKALYVEGENVDAKTGRNLMWVQPVAIKGLIVKTDPEGPEAKRTGRYPISTFGLKQAMERVIRAWGAAEAEKALHVQYQGLKKVQELGGKTCHTIRRAHPEHPEEEDGVTDCVLYIDQDSLFQVGTVLKNAKGELLGEYFFLDIKLNPQFDPGQFDRTVLKK